MFQPLRDLVLIERENVVTEEQRPSGLVVLKSNFSLYNWGQDEILASDIISKKKQNKGRIIATGNACTFFKEGDEVIYKKMTEEKKIIYDGKDCVLVKESDILCKNELGIQVCHPDNIIVKISKEDRDELFSRKIKRNNGEVIELLIANPTPEDDVNHNERFVAAGEVIFVGDNITDISIGDLAIVDYLVDTDSSIVIGYHEENKLVSVLCKTKFCDKDEWVFANRTTEIDRNKNSYGQRLCVRDIKVSEIGDYEEMSRVYGVIHEDKLLSIKPFIFLQHEHNVYHRVSTAGILYTESLKILERNVLSVPVEEFDIKEGDTIICDDYDIFDIIYKGLKIHCVNDKDILLKNNA